MVPESCLSYGWLTPNTTLLERRVPVSLRIRTTPSIWGGEKSTGAEGEVGLPMPGVVVGLNFKVGDEMVAADIVLKWGKITLGSGACIL